MSKVYKHHCKDNYGMYGNVNNSLTKQPFIIEFVSNKSPVSTKVLDNVEISLTARKYDIENDEYQSVSSIFFDRVIAYNSKQSTGEIKLVINEGSSNYLLNQISDDNNSVIVSSNEGTWRISNFRDNVVLYDKPLFSKTWSAIKDKFPIDKVINPTTYSQSNVIDYNKLWDEKQLLRDKYSIVRLISDNKDENVQLIFNYSVEQITNSIR